ncbi:phage holin family protein [uncultured Tateyamaria sp.]|uniref:phage holin family protein n=1 Tax=uncultured Tateyamaria sp. TaxID=455651 RepID=UPI00263091F2|nr:phage holin family protein [uncultured Tateyamaria sp.]
MQPHPSPLAQIENVAAHLRGLLISEWRLARGEMAQNLRAARTGLILAAIGFAATFSALFALTAALFLGLTALGLAAWLAALATGTGLLIVSALALWLGLNRLSPKAIAPTRTAAHAAETIRLVTEKTHVS